MSRELLVCVLCAVWLMVLGWWFVWVKIIGEAGGWRFADGRLGVARLQWSLVQAQAQEARLWEPDGAGAGRPRQTKANQGKPRQ